jgi:signal transduction histidine kinase
MTRGEGPGQEVRLLSRDGTLVNVHLTCTGLSGIDSIKRQVRIAMTGIDDRKKYETALDALQVDQALAQVTRELIRSDLDIRALATLVLDTAKQLTGSPNGFVSIIDPVTRENVGYTSAKARQGSETEGKIVFPANPDGSYSGLWGHALNTLKPFYTNSPTTHPSAAGVPAWHLPIQRFLSVPVVIEGTLAGQIALANARNPYTDRDLGRISKLGEIVAIGVQRLRAEEENDRIREMMIQSEKMASVGGLAAGMAHEINNPLAGMIQNAQVILNRLTAEIPANQSAAGSLGFSLPDLRAYLEHRGILTLLASLREAGQRAAGIVENMLSFSRMGSPVKTRESLPRLLDATIALAATGFDLDKGENFRSITLVRDFDPTVPKIPCEGTKLQQVFLNIIRNGAEAMFGEKAAAPGTGEGAPQKQHRFVFRILNQAPWVRIVLEDNGPGIEPAVLKRIFEPFFTTKPVGTGTGLGLSVSYFIITENHGGTLEAESRPGKGARFIIHLPMDGETPARPSQERPLPQAPDPSRPEE